MLSVQANEGLMSMFKAFLTSVNSLESSCVPQSSRRGFSVVLVAPPLFWLPPETWSEVRRCKSLEGTLLLCRPLLKHQKTNAVRLRNLDDSNIA